MRLDVRKRDFDIYSWLTHGSCCDPFVADSSPTHRSCHEPFVAGKQAHFSGREVKYFPYFMGVPLDIINTRSKNKKDQVSTLLTFKSISHQTVP